MNDHYIMWVNDHYLMWVNDHYLMWVNDHYLMWVNDHYLMWVNDHYLMWVNDHYLMWVSNVSSISRQEQDTFQWDGNKVCFVLEQHTWLDFYSANWLKQQSLSTHVAPLWHIIHIPSPLVFALTPYCWVLSGEAANANFIIFGLTQPGLKLTIYHTQGKHANHYTTNVVMIVIGACNHSYFLCIISPHLPNDHEEQTCVYYTLLLMVERQHKHILITVP